MSKRYGNNSKFSQYDDYENSSYSYKKKDKPKRKESNFAFGDMIDPHKQKVSNRYLNKKRDKDKYDRDDDWN